MIERIPEASEIRFDYLTVEDGASLFGLWRPEIEVIYINAKAMYDYWQRDDFEHNQAIKVAIELGKTLESWWDDDEWDKYWDDTEIEAELEKAPDKKFDILGMNYTNEEIGGLLAAARLFYREFYTDREYATKKSKEEATDDLKVALRLS